jgi:hypothetical protein
LHLVVVHGLTLSYVAEQVKQYYFLGVCRKTWLLFLGVIQSVCAPHRDPLNQPIIFTGRPFIA